MRYFNRRWQKTAQTLTEQGEGLRQLRRPHKNQATQGLSGSLDIPVK
jgi:hypothetical protein